jgi:hypothetical protein
MVVNLSPSCYDCVYRYDTTVGDLVLVHDLISADQQVDWCSFYNEEIDDKLKEKCYKECNFKKNKN